MPDEDAHARRLTLVDRLQSPAWTLLPSANRPAVEFLAEAAPRWPAWPIGLGLAWCDHRQPAIAPSAACDRVLVVSEREVQGRAQLVADIVSPSHLAPQVPAHNPNRRCVSLPQHDALDAIALALDAAQPLGPEAPRMLVPAKRPGQLLRDDLARWLREGAPGDLRLPSLAWGLGGAAPAGASEPVALTASAWGLGGAAPAGASEPVALTASAWGPALVGELAAELRQGAWSALLEQIVIQLTTRLPSAHPNHIYAVELLEDERRVTYCLKARGGTRLTLRRTGQGAPWLYTLAGQADLCHPLRFQGPDALLQALLPRRRGDGSYPAHEIRCALAGEMLAHPALVRLCAALQQRFPDHPRPDALLRLCMCGGQLTEAGRQLLDSSRPARDPTADDLIRWCDGKSVPPGKRLQTFLDDGVDILKAHDLFGPIGPTPAGRELLRSRNAAHLGVMSGPTRRAHIAPELSSLLYTYQNLRGVGAYLGYSGSSIQRQCEALWESARERVDMWQLQDQLFASSSTQVPDPMPGSMQGHGTSASDGRLS